VERDGHEEVDDETRRRGEADRRPEETEQQTGSACEKDEREQVEPVLGDARPEVGLNDLRPVGKLSERRVGQGCGEEDGDDRGGKEHGTTSIYTNVQIHAEPVLSPQRSNRANLLEGTLRCLERLPPERVTARAIAAESGANLASIAYHFGSKDTLVTEAVIEGLDRWLGEIEAGLRDVALREPAVRFRRAAEVIETTRRRNAGLAVNFLGALGKAQHDARVRELLVEGFRRTRPTIALLLGLGSDQAGEDAAGLLHSQFTGLLFQVLLDPGLAIDGDRLEYALARLARVLPS
jgi:AcrR family transcriptional regulator